MAEKEKKKEAKEKLKAKLEEAKLENGEDLE